LPTIIVIITITICKITTDIYIGRIPFHVVVVVDVSALKIIKLCIFYNPPNLLGKGCFWELDFFGDFWGQLILNPEGQIHSKALITFPKKMISYPNTFGF
jgi:hypothetical protein